MKMMTICNCDECKYFRSVDTEYRVYCDLQEESIRYKDYGTRNFHWNESVAKLYQMCPLIDVDELLRTPAEVVWERLYNGL